MFKIFSEKNDSIRRSNRANVMRLVFERPGIDRTEIATSVRLTNAAISNIVNELIQANLIVEAQATHSVVRRGRRRVGLKINPRGGYVLGVSAVATNSSIVLADIGGRSIDEIKFVPDQIDDPFKTLDQIHRLSMDILKRNNVPDQLLFGVGFAVAGYLSREGKGLERAPYLGWPKFDLKSSLIKLFDMPVAIENVNRCIALAEVRFGGLVNVSNLVLIRSALGLGGAVMIDGELLRGEQNLGGDLGHILAEPGGQMCSCGKRGCLNTVASGWAVMVKMGVTRQSYGTINQFRWQNSQLENLLGDNTCVAANTHKVLAEAGVALARHLMPTLQVLNPETVCLTGPLGRHPSYALAFRQHLAELGFSATVILANETKIVTASVASAYLALSNMVYSPHFSLSQTSRSLFDDKVVAF